MKPVRLVLICLVVALFLGTQLTVDARGRRAGRRKGDRKRQRKPKVDAQDDVQPCLRTAALKKKFQNRWVRSFTLLKKDTHELMKDVGCKFNLKDCKLPNFSAYKPTFHKMQVSCAAEYIKSVVKVLEDFHRNLTTIHETVGHLERELKVKKKELSQPTNVLLNDIANTVSKYGGAWKINYISTPHSVTTIGASVVDVWTSFSFFLKDFDLFVDNVVSVIKLR